MVPMVVGCDQPVGPRAMGPTPLQGRQITPDHARAITETGGSIGIWYFFSSLDKYVDGLKEMAEIVGVDHVSIGTDQHVMPGTVQDYTQWVHLVAAMLRSGVGYPEALSKLPDVLDWSSAPS
jgi:membrane dipeptidase